ncbi:hypothetical protein L218DRAFT_939559 [Marasmius fiardii PR-910]|nr:hypothetical protein L218DRAFT_939559 [Marasmius fiardii PR-910]
MSLHDPVTTKSNDQQSSSSNLFVSVIARAISSVGFGVSLVAIGVLWLFPSALGETNSPALTALEDISRRKERESRRISAPPILSGPRLKPRKLGTSPTAKSVIVVPVVVTPSSEALTISNGNSSRRVYFLEPQERPRNSRRFSAPLPEPTSTEPRTPIPQIPEDVSPRSSSSTLVHVPTPTYYSVTLDPCLETIESANSDSSSKCSSTTRQPSRSASLTSRFKGRWARQSSGVATDFGPDTPAAVVEQPTPAAKSGRRSSPPWSIMTKPRPLVDLSLSPPSPFDCSPKPTALESPFFRTSRKTSGNEKGRPTTPQRTQPYDYPYFAEPPIAVSACKPRNVDSDSSSSHNPNRLCEKRNKNVQAQASLGLGRKPPQRRSTSVV